MTARTILFLIGVVLAAASSQETDLVGVRTLDSSNDDGAVSSEAGEERFLFTSTSTVTVNSTLLRAIGAIIGALLLALPLYLAYATAAGGSDGSYGYYKRSGRFKRSADDGKCTGSLTHLCCRREKRLFFV